MNWVRGAFAVAVAVGVLVLIAAAQPATPADGKVSGTVTVAGKPLDGGRVYFHLADGQFVGCKVKDGKYAIDRVPAGTRKVTVEGKGVPAKYAGDETSPLTTEVKGGDNMFAFDLE